MIVRRLLDDELRRAEKEKKIMILHRCHGQLWDGSASTDRAQQGDPRV